MKFTVEVGPGVVAYITSLIKGIYRHRDKEVIS
jgi:hypothetical protein